MLTSKQYHDLLKAKLKRFSRSQEEWKKFLETSSRMYKYGFKESVSIFAQKPNTTACAEIKTWKKATNRRVIRTSEAIGLVYSTDNVNVTSIRYVFDISNTVKVNEQSKTPYFWTLMIPAKNVCTTNLSRHTALRTQSTLKKQSRKLSVNA